MHILCVNPYFFPYIGGIENAIYQLATNILELDNRIKISLLCTYSSYPSGYFDQLPSEEFSNGINIHRINFSPKDIPGLYHSYNAGFFSHTTKKTLEIIRPDIIHYFKTEWYIPNSTIYSHTKKIRQVFTSSYHYKPIHTKHLIQVWFNRFLLNKMDKIIVPSSETAGALSKTFSVNFDKIHIIPWGVKESTAGIKIKNNDGKINILCTGRLNTGKGQFRFLQEFLRFPQDIINQSRLIFVGDNDGDLARINQLISEKHLKNVILLSKLAEDKLEEIIINADIFISPSSYEAFGLSIIDSINYGTPVVAFNRGAIAEVAPKGAILIDYPDWSRFGNAVIDLIRDPQLRKLIGQEGQTFVSSNYSWKKTALRYIQLYTEVLH